MVGGVHYRNPGLWVKAATTLDVISGAERLGIGAAWNQAESEGRLPLAEPARPVRDARGHPRDRPRDGGASADRRRPSRPPVPREQAPERPPVDLPPAGPDHDRWRRQKKTLRLVAKYADASNLFGGPADLPPKYAILAEHCAAVGRDFTEIERTNLQGVALSERSASGRAVESPVEIVERFGRLAEAVQCVIISTADAYDPAALEVLGRDVLPQLRDLEAADPRHVTAVPAA